MKRFVVILLVLPCLVFAQEYFFDLKCTSEDVRVKPRDKKLSSSFSFLLLSSKNSNVYAFQRKNNDLIIEDYNSLESLHIGKLHNQFIVNSVNEIKYDYREFTIEKGDVSKIDDLTYLIKTFPTKKSRKSNLEVLFKLRKSNFPLVKIQFMDLSPMIHEDVYNYLLKELENLNYQIESAFVDYRNGYKFNFKWSQCDKVNLKFNFKTSD